MEPGKTSGGSSENRIYNQWSDFSNISQIFRMPLVIRRGCRQKGKRWEETQNLTPWQGGELNAQFRQAIRLVGRNIMDPNMDPAASRGITVTLSFKPRGDGTVGLGFKVVPKLAGPAKVETTLLIGQDIRTGQVSMQEPGEISRPVVVEAEEVRDYDPDTGEIYEQPPIDLRAKK